MTKHDMNQEKFDALQGKIFGDVGGAVGILMSYIGDQSGAYKALEDIGPCSHVTLATKTGIDERYLREWLSANAAAGYVTFDAINDQFSLSPEQAAIFSHEGEPTNMQGFFEVLVSQYKGLDSALEVFKTGRARPWSEHQNCCFCGTDRFFRAGYAANLIGHWIPSLDGVDEKLKAGAKVADIGCGYGSSTILMAQHYPNSRFIGFDFHAQSIKGAQEKAQKAGITNVEFQLNTAKEYPGKNFDFVCIFDALHDMGDPVGAVRHIRQSLTSDGSFMVVEPIAADNLEDNLHLLGAIFYGFSTTMCVPASKAQEVGLALGAQAGQRRITEVLTNGGFSKVRRATETPINMILEAKI